MNRHWKYLLALPLLLSAACTSVTQALQSATPQHAEYHAPARPATSASVTLASIPENIVVNPASSESYFDAEIDYLATINYSAEGHNEDYTVSLVERAQTLTYNGAPLTWDIGIKPTTPLSLSVGSSSGDLTLNLNDFTLTAFDAETSSGRIDAHLPAAEPYSAALETSSGNATVSLEDEAAVEFSQFKSSSGALTLNTGNGSTLMAAFETSSGDVTVNGGSGLALTGGVTTSSGEVALNFGANTAAALDISTSSGSITVSVPQNAALRLQIEDNSSGSVNVPAWLGRVSGEDKTGVWESAGFAQAERQIVIRVTHDASGPIRGVEAS